MQLLPREPYRRTAYLVFYILLGAVGIYAFFRWLFPLLLPFLLAFATATLLRRPSAAIARGTKLPGRVVSVILVLFFLAVVIFLFVIAASAATEQLVSLADGLMQEEERLFAAFDGVLEKLGAFAAKLPFFAGEDAAALRVHMTEAIAELLKNAVLSLSAKIPTFVGAVIALVPVVLLSMVVTILSAIYFCLGYDHVTSFLKGKLSASHLGLLRDIYGQMGKTGARFLRSYAILFLLTFAELFAGLVILRQKYALLLALVIAVVDVLPVLGTGTVLIPWAGFLFFAGESKTAWGLLILYGVITVLRQILEPRIVGAEIGLPPIVSLFCMYTGLRLLGVFGMILMPILVVIAGGIVKIFRTHRTGEATS